MTSFITSVCSIYCHDVNACEYQKDYFIYYSTQGIPPVTTQRGWKERVKYIVLQETGYT
jgi:hypothetical protein